ncbi:hypothetical protein HY449_02605 [Candidatus Pacearchaeota archaeon]|nr:hypothetical protein [Candidatus Pacearchaeota archaeon]
MLENFLGKNKKYLRSALIAGLSSSLILLGACKNEDDSEKDETVNISGTIVFRNYDTTIYEAFINGNSKGAIPENIDVSNPYMYGMSIITVTDMFVNPGMGEGRGHMLDFRLEGTIHDTKNFITSPRGGNFYAEECIKNYRFAGC